MSVANSQPTPHDPSDGPLGAEFEATSDLLTFLHLYHENADRDDAHVRRSIAGMATALAVHGPVPPVEPKFYIARGSEVASTEDPQDQLEMFGYGEMEWTPREGTATAELTDRILVRYPRIRSTRFKGVRNVNDIIIMINEDSYLLNSQGIVPFADSESLVLDKSPLEDNPQTSVLPDVFSVRGDYHWAAAPLSAVGLRTMLLQESTYSQREDA